MTQLHKSYAGKLIYIFFKKGGGSGLKSLPVKQETRVQSLGEEDPLEKAMATHFSILAWKIPWTEKPSRLQSTGVPKSQTRLSDFTFAFLKKKRTFIIPGFKNLNKRIPR